MIYHAQEHRHKVWNLYLMWTKYWVMQCRLVCRSKETYRIDVTGMYWMDYVEHQVVRDVRRSAGDGHFRYAPPLADKTLSFLARQRYGPGPTESR